MPMRLVAAAMNDSIVHASNVGDDPLGWSDDETKSKPNSSARTASETGSAPAEAVVAMFTPINRSMIRPYQRPQACARLMIDLSMDVKIFTLQCLV